jgi:hypothetical protein
MTDATFVRLAIFVIVGLVVGPSALRLIGIAWALAGRAMDRLEAKLKLKEVVQSRTTDQDPI